ncbi:MAG: hypothetical protein LBE59_02595 [Nevskiaceae bacterium]|jgi:hypothetical protein|nr:hypothetical protein [Nevskiaceae bacterium]
MKSKYSEEILRHAASRSDGGACEILERLTWETRHGEDGQPLERALFNRRFDLKTGERVNRLGDDEFEIDGSGERLRLLRA